jgi:hypothetical protein
MFSDILLMFLLTYIALVNMAGSITINGNPVTFSNSGGNIKVSLRVAYNDNESMID